MGLVIPAYCLFSMWCFGFQISPLTLTGFNTNDANGIGYPVPTSCYCYQAPENPYSVDDLQLSNSIICHGEQDEAFYRYFSPKQANRVKIKLNTMVLKKFEKYKENSVILEADNVVLESMENSNLQYFKGTYRYLTIYNQKELREMPTLDSKELKGIYIIGHSEGATEFKFWPQDLPKLESFTMQKTIFSTIVSKEFLSSYPLKTIDLSENRLINVDSLVITNLQNVNKHLNSLYLNNNRLTSIPQGLTASFPNLKILHVYGNLIKIYDSQALLPLLKIEELVIMDGQGKLTDFDIYNYGDIEKWLPNSNTEDLNLPLGLMNFLPNLNLYCDNAKNPRVPYMPGMDLSTARNGTFIRANFTQRTVSFYGLRIRGREEIIELRGPVVDFLRQDLRSLNSKRNTVWIRLLSSDPIEDNHYYGLKNLLSQAEVDNEYVVFKFEKLRKTDLDKPPSDNKILDMLSYVIDRRYSFIGFEVLILDESFEKITYDDSDKRVCPIKFPTKELEDKFYDTVEAYKLLSKMVSTIEYGEFIMMISIDAKCLQVIETFNYDFAVKKCFSDENVKIDGINVINIDTEDMHNKEQKQSLVSFRDNYDEIVFQELHNGKKDHKRIVTMLRE